MVIYDNIFYVKRRTVPVPVRLRLFRSVRNVAAAGRAASGDSERRSGNDARSYGPDERQRCLVTMEKSVVVYACGFMKYHSTLQLLL